MSLQVATIRGIPIRLHVSMLVIVLLLTVQLGAWGLPAGVLLFGSIVLHELGHAVVAQVFGVRTAEIQLHLLGGVAKMVDWPRSPRQELAIAAAGPAVSLALAGLFGVLALLLGGRPDLVPRSGGDLVASAAVVNLGLGLFNLLPALPMDGGRIFRAALSDRLGEVRATEIAATVSRVFGGLFVAVALFSGAFTLGLIGLFLLFWVGREEESARIRQSLDAVRREPGPSYVPFGPLSDRFGAGRSPSQVEVVVDVDPRRPSDPRRVVIDPWGRPWRR